MFNHRLRYEGILENLLLDFEIYDDITLVRSRGRHELRFSRDPVRSDTQDLKFSRVIPGRAGIFGPARYRSFPPLVKSLKQGWAMGLESHGICVPGHESRDLGLGFEV